MLQILLLESHHPSSDKVSHPRPHGCDLHETLIPDAHVLCHHVWPVGREGQKSTSERFNERVGREDGKDRKERSQWSKGMRCGTGGRRGEEGQEGEESRRGSVGGGRE